MSNTLASHDEAWLGIQMYLEQTVHAESTATATVALPPFPDRGVSLSFLRQFMAKNRDRLTAVAATAPVSVPESLDEAIQAVNGLREVPWDEEEVAQVESKIRAIGLTSVQQLREVLSMELLGDDFSGVPINQQLRAAGKSAFSGKTKRLFAKALRIKGFGDASVSAQRQQTLTTSQVCAQIVRPDTEGTGGAYVDLILAEQTPTPPAPPLVGKATHFVSHTWSYFFSDLIAGIEAFAAESLGSPGAAAEEGGTKEEEAFFWIDIFSVDENRAADPTNALPQAWWSSTFMDAIASIGQTVLVLSPWDAPRPCT